MDESKLRIEILPEIWFQIISFLCIRDRKTLSLVSRGLCAFSQPEVFRQLEIRCQGGPSIVQDEERKKRLEFWSLPTISTGVRYFCFEGDSRGWEGESLFRKIFSDIWPGFANLKSLELRFTTIDNHALDAIIGLPPLKTLRVRFCRSLFTPQMYYSRIKTETFEWRNGRKCDPTSRSWPTLLCKNHIQRIEAFADADGGQFLSAFLSCPDISGKLVALSIPEEVEVLDQLNSLLPLTPQLEELHFGTSPLQEETSTEFSKAASRLNPVNLPMLKVYEGAPELIINQMLIPGPLLLNLRLRHTRERWEISVSSPILLKALKAVPTLEFLEILKIAPKNVFPGFLEFIFASCPALRRLFIDDDLDSSGATRNFCVDVSIFAHHQLKL